MTAQERKDRKQARIESERRMQQARETAITAVRSNSCPQCGGHVHFNTALTGWVQCDGFGAEGFRKDPNAIPCDWQGFTA